MRVYVHTLNLIHLSQIRVGFKKYPYHNLHEFQRTPTISSNTVGTRTEIFSDWVRMFSERTLGVGARVRRYWDCLVCDFDWKRRVWPTSTWPPRRDGPSAARTHAHSGTLSTYGSGRTMTLPYSRWGIRQTNLVALSNKLPFDVSKKGVNDHFYSLSEISFVQLCQVLFLVSRETWSKGFRK